MKPRPRANACGQPVRGTTRRGAFAALLAVGLLHSSTPADERTAASAGKGQGVGRASGGSSDSVLVFGPENYINWGPQGSWTYYDEIFNTTVARGRRYVVEIKNGPAKVSGLTFSVNGQQWVGSSEFGFNTSRVLRRIEVEDQNTLHLELNGQSQSSVDLRIVHVKEPNFVVYGPEIFVRPDSIQPQVDSFTVASSAKAPHTLYVINGAPDGTSRVTNATLKLNNVQVLGASDFGVGKATITKNVTLQSSNTIELLNQSAAGSYLSLRFWATDSTPPVLAISSPAESLVTEASYVLVSGTVGDECDGTVSVNGRPWFPTPGAFTDSIPLPADGHYTFTVHAANGAEYSVDSVRHVTRDTQAPTLNVTSPANYVTTTDSIAVVICSWADSTRTTVTVDGEVAASAAIGADTLTFPLDFGPNRILVRAVDAAGHKTEVTRFVFRNPVGEGQGADSVTHAPALSATRSTAFLDQVKFLYTGDTQGNTLQLGVVSDSIQADLAAVVRGRVTARDFAALPNVTVRVLGHDEFGYAVTRAGGRFDLVVNGGAPLTLRFMKPGYLEAQRAVQVPVNDYALLDDVALIGKSLKVNVVSFDSLRLVRGRFASDANGDREIRVLFQPGTVARIARTVGDTASLNAIRLRLTEYTVGADGPRAMPALLPPTSAYTYCVDFSVDEADSIGQILHPELPAPDVLFSKTVVHHVRNFLNLPVGTAVPAGYYERRTGKWVADRDGWVVRILTDSGGTVAIDSNGDGAADGSSRRDSLGVTPSELGVLSAEFDAGDVIWRATSDRFSNKDINLNLSPAMNFAKPGVVPRTEPLTPNPCQRSGSIINCEDRILGESIPIVGTPYTLNYRSFRASGDSVMRTVRVPVVGSTLPPSNSSIRQAIVELDVAGKRYVRSVPGPLSLAMEPVSVTWDGLDAYGRPVNGAVTGRLSIGYEFVIGVSAGTGGQSLGDPASSGTSLGEASGDRAVGTIVWNRQTISLGAPGTGSDGLGGWTISPHHYYDNAGQGTLYLGDGSVIRGDLFGQTARQDNPYNTCQNNDVFFVGDLIAHPTALAYGRNGALYIGDRCRTSILRVNRYGVVRRIAGTNSPGTYVGDGPATERSLPFDVVGLAVAPDGSVYFASSRWINQDQGLVGVVTPDGVIRKIIGGKSGESYGGGDGRPASEAWIGYVTGLALGPDGSLFIVDDGGVRVRRIGTNEIISTYAGTGGNSSNDSTGVATGICISDAVDVEVDDDGVLYILEHASRRIKRVSPDGIMSTLATLNLSSTWSNYGPYVPQDMALAPDGSMYFSAESWYMGVSTKGGLLRRWPDGTTAILAGEGNASPYAIRQSGLPTSALFLYANAAIACHQDGTAIYGGGNLVRVSGPFAVGVNQVEIPSSDGGEVFVFAARGDSAGRHLYTRDALTGAIRYQFGYDVAGRLTTILEAAGLATTIQRDGSGKPLAIVGPFGQRTRLGVDANGHLGTASDTVGNTYELTTRTDGLLETFGDPLDNSHTFAYAVDGRLAQDQAPPSTATELNLTVPTYQGMKRTVTVTTGEGRQTSYSVANLWNGTRQREVVSPAGLRAFRSDSTDARIFGWWPEGSSSTDSLQPDARFGMAAPVVKLSRLRMPNGMTRTVATTRTITTDFDPPFQDGTWSEDVRINSRAPHHTQFNSDSLVLRVQTSVGRTAMATVDSAGRPLTVAVPGLADIAFSYNAQGQVGEVSQGGRGIRFGYDPRGRLG